MGCIVKLVDGWHSQTYGWVGYSNLRIGMIIKIMDRNGIQTSIYGGESN